MRTPGPCSPLIRLPAFALAGILLLGGCGGNGILDLSKVFAALPPPA